MPRTLIKIEAPATQSVEAVKALLRWRGRAVDPMPSKIEFMDHSDNSRMMLVLSSKKDGYYTVTSRACSCPASTHRPGKPCKHIRALQAAMESESIRPQFDEPFRPFSELASERVAAEVA